MKKSAEQKEKILIGLKKARTSLDKIIQLLEHDDDAEEKCFDIIQQNLAVIGLLKSANVAMLENNLDTYLEHISKKGCSKKDINKTKDDIIRIVQVAQNK